MLRLKTIYEIYCVILSIVFFYNFRAIESQTFMAKAENIFTDSAVPIQFMSFYLLIAGVIMFYHQYTTFKNQSNNVKLTVSSIMKQSTILYFIGALWLFWNYASTMRVYISPTISYSIVVFLTSCFVFKQWHNFVQIHRLKYLFKETVYINHDDATDENEENVDGNQKQYAYPIKHKDTVTFLFALISFNVIVNILIKTYNLTFIGIFIIIRLLMTSTLFAPIFFNKKWKVLKYDFYQHQNQFLLWNLCNSVFMTVEIIWALSRDYHSAVMDILYIIYVTALIFGGSIYPGFHEQRKQKLFKQKISCMDSIIVDSQNIDNNSTWSHFIETSNDNFNSFSNFLCDSYCIENLLFIIDVMKYKNKSISMITSYRKTIDEHALDENDHESAEYVFGSVLPFYQDDHLPTSPIVHDLGRNDIESQNNNNYVLSDDMDVIFKGIEDLYQRYINPYDRSLAVGFISEQTAFEITDNLSKLKNKFENEENIDDNLIKNDAFIQELLSIFDNALNETSALLQFMFREFIITKQ